MLSPHQPHHCRSPPELERVLFSALLGAAIAAGAPPVARNSGMYLVKLFDVKLA